MSRKKDIFEKLDYADHRFNELGDMVFKGGMQRIEIQHLSGVASDILASCREVYDFCALDIAENCIAPNDAKTASDLSDGKIRAYYPFYKSQLIKKGNLFFKLQSINIDFYNYLVSIADLIEQKKVKPNTLIGCDLLIELSEMVNEKKHNKLLKTAPSGTSTIFSHNEVVQIMIPVAEQVGISHIKLPEDAVHGLGDRYVFEYNKRDVMDFCMKCKTLTRILMEEFYDKYLT